MADIIEARGLTVKYGDKTAVDGIDLRVHRGEIFGFLGPNGAGKTTTVKVLTTIRRPTAGNIVLDGRPLTGNLSAVRSEIGLVQQHIVLDKDISVRENLYCHAMLHKIPRSEIKQRTDDICAAVELTPHLDSLVNNLSGGWKRKAAIACALLHKPKVLFLDEPTAGLDTQSRHMLWELIRVLNRRGTTIFLTTHYMDEAESLCDRVSVISKGKIADTGTPRELCEHLGRTAVEYDGPNGREYRYFRHWDEGKAFYESLGSENAVLRGTHLEDVYLEETGRENAALLKKVLRI